MTGSDAKRAVAAPGLLSGIVFFAVVLVGAGYIVFSKLQDLPAVYVTVVPVLIMIAYALLLGLTRLFRLRDDQSGDNLYYMGFLFTLTSLAVSLYQYSEEGSAEQIVRNFGVAIASTIAGIALRIFFNQMRRDPLEVESTARLELANASRKVKRELEGTVLEFAYFRRATQQSLAEAIEEVSTQLKEAKQHIVDQLDEFAAESSKPLEEASRKSGDTIQHLNDRIAEALDNAVKHISKQTEELSNSTALIIKSFETVVSKLAALQTPDHIIEIKLNPMIQGLSRAVNNFGKHAEVQARAVDANLKQTQLLTDALRVLLADTKARATTPPDHHTMGHPAMGHSDRDMGGTDV
jgi:hypothetical protein